MLPFDFGTTPAADAGIPGLNLDDDFTSGLPAFFIGGDGDRRRFDVRIGPRASTAATARSIRTRSSSSWSATSRSSRATTASSSASTCGAPTTCACRAIAHRSGELTFNARSHPRTRTAAAWALATFLLGDVTHVRPLRQPDTDARERQWRHFYYAQDTWRAEPQADAQLRPAARRHQPADGQRGGQRRLSRSDDRQIKVGGRRRHRPERQRREHAQLGAARSARPISSTRRR